jgi:hypothetical protein
VKTFFITFCTYIAGVLATDVVISRSCFKSKQERDECKIDVCVASVFWIIYWIAYVIYQITRIIERAKDK